MSLLGKLFGNTNSLSRIRKLKAKGEWGGLLVSKNGEEVVELHGGVIIPNGNWLLFLFHLETMQDGRIIFSDSSCVWLNLLESFELKAYSNMFYPVPNGIEKYLTNDGSYPDWEKAFQSIDHYFSNDKDWQYQWSGKSERINNLLLGKLSNWISYN